MIKGLENIPKTQRTKALIFSVVVIIKIVLMGLFSSDYQNEMFMPFIGEFFKGENPYRFYYENNLASAFPYMPLMLLIEAVGGLLLKLFAVNSVFLSNILFKLPLLVFDIIGFFYIEKMIVRYKYAMLLYFCSPIIIYSTYMHGQLDIIPTVLLLISIYYLTDWKKKSNLWLSAVLLGLALSTKTHIIAALPIIFFYISSKKNIKKAIYYFIISIGIPLFFALCFWNQGLIENVFFNKEQSVLLTVSMDYGTTQILIPIIAVLIIYAKAYELNYFNRNLFISLMGLLFAVFLICIPPMPAWFVWIVPFIALYFGYVMNDKYKVMTIYAIFNVLYLIYFIFLHQTKYTDLYFGTKSLQYIKINNLELKYIIFTGMAATLGIIIYKIYVFGIASNDLYRRGNVPFTIGIAGDSGAGKTSLLEKVKLLLGTEKDVLFIEGDGDHKWERNDEQWENFTALNPQANYLYKQAEDIHILRYGYHVERADYDHDTGKFTERQLVRSKKYIVLSGLHSLYLPQLRRELDLKIFLDTDNELRNYWKIQRDTAKRGYSKEKILEQINKRIPDAEKYIYPQKKYADLIITYFDKTLSSVFEDNHEVELSVKFNLDIYVDLEPLVQEMKKIEINPVITILDDFQKQEITFDGAEACDKEIDFQNIASLIIPQYDDLFVNEIKWDKGITGIVQLFLIIMISDKMRGL